MWRGFSIQNISFEPPEHPVPLLLEVGSFLYSFPIEQSMDNIGSKSHTYWGGLFTIYVVFIYYLKKLNSWHYHYVIYCQQLRFISTFNVCTNNIKEIRIKWCFSITNKDCSAFILINNNDISCFFFHSLIACWLSVVFTDCVLLAAVVDHALPDSVPDKTPNDFFVFCTNCIRLRDI